MADEALCAVEWCGKKIHLRGYCRPHYEKSLKHGWPVAGRSVAGEAEAWLRWHASDSSDECLIWPWYRNPNGYGRLTLHGHGQQYAHRLMCVLVNGAAPSEHHEAAHTCGCGHLGCVSPRHLVWKTRQQNKDDELRHGTRNYGERNGGAILTREIVLFVKKRLAAGEKQKNLAEQFGVSRGAISDIARQKNWSWL